MLEKPLFKMEDQQKLQIIAPYLFCMQYLRFSKDMYVLNCTNICIINFFLHVAQSGFRQVRSFQTATTKVIYEWLKCLDNQGKVGTVFLEFSKVFDLINHVI